MAENIGAVSFGISLTIGDLEAQLLDIGESAGTALQSVLSGVFSSSFVSGFFTAIQTGFLGITGGALSAGQGILSAMSQAWGGVQSAWSGADGWFSSLWNNMRGAFDGAPAWRVPFAQAWGGIQSVWSGAGGWFGSLWNSLRGAFDGAPAWRVPFTQAWNGIQSVWSGAGGWFGSVSQNITGAFDDVSDGIRSAFLSGISFLESLPEEAAGWGADIATSLAEGILDAAGTVRAAVGGIAEDIRSFLHFSEPDTGPLVGFHTWPKDMLEGMADDIGQNRGTVTTAVGSLADGMADALQTSFSAVVPLANIRTDAAALSGTSGASVTNNTRMPVININGPVSLAQPGGEKQLLQQLQFLSAI